MDDLILDEGVFADRTVVDDTAVELRKLQIKLFNKQGSLGRIATPQGRAASQKLNDKIAMVATIAWALEEGRLHISEPTEETMVARMSADVDFHFGVAASESPKGPDEPE